LGSHRCESSITGASKCHEEGITLGIDLVAIELEEGGTQQGPTCFQDGRVALT
jgi:hypothetical protein